MDKDTGVTEDVMGMMEAPDETYVTTGEVALPGDTGESSAAGDTVEEEPDEYELMGDVVYVEEGFEL